MQERLVIKNFGPIESVDLELGKMTILIGDQATGKSTIAKVLAVCRYFDYIIPFSTSSSSKRTNFRNGLINYGINNYINDNSYIKYFNDHYEMLVSYETEFNPMIKPLSSKFNEIMQLAEDIFIEVDKFPNRFYEDFVKNILQNPLFTPIERILQSISFNKDLLLSEATQDHLRKLRRIAMNYSNPTEIPVLNLNFYSNNGYDFVKRKEEKSFYKLAESASGWQSTTSIVLGIKYYNEIKPKQKTFIIEEPENNLFPKIQKKLVEFFVENIINHGHQFILPTHSPYILSALNNCLYAYKLSQLFNESKDEIKQIIPENYWMNIDDISVYYIENGTAKDLVDREEALINIDDLDCVSKKINLKFDELLHFEIQQDKLNKV
jgi:predicted ATPase